MSRDTALARVGEIDGNCSQKYINSFCDYIGISIEDFHQKCIEIVNKELFVLDGNSF